MDFNHIPVAKRANPQVRAIGRVYCSLPGGGCVPAGDDPLDGGSECGDRGPRRVADEVDSMRKRSRNNVQETCYMCDMPETSNEHVPPKCFFPEQKDIGEGRDYRQNLLTVPSCDLHNSKKSEDDEYLQFVITIHFENNPIAQKQFSTKIMRAVRRKPSMYNFIKENFPVAINGLPSLAFTIDQDRFDKEIDHITRALYYLHHKSKLSLPIIVHTPDLFMVNQPTAKDVNQRMQQIDKMTIDALTSQPIHGENPEIFSYQFLDLEEIPSFVVRMVFYSGFVVIAYASQTVNDSKK